MELKEVLDMEEMLGMMMQEMVVEAGMVVMPLEVKMCIQKHMAVAALAILAD